MHEANMRIDNPQLSQLSANSLQQQAGVSEVQNGRAGQRGQSADGSDSVQLSNLGTALRDLAAEDPDRAQAVQAIAAAVQAGTYQVDASAVSRKIVQELTTA
jgi:flagellar biosynthesis anti-sigma factor FlgM